MGVYRNVRIAWLALFLAGMVFVYPVYGQDAPAKRKDPRAEFEARRAAKAREAAGGSNPAAGQERKPEEKTQEKPAPEPVPEARSKSGFRVGDKIRWRMGDEVFAGSVVLIPDDDTLRVTRDGDGKRAMIYVNWVVRDRDSGFNGAAAQAAVKGFYLAGQNIEFKDESGSKTAVVVLDMGEAVAAYEESELRVIPRGAIQSAPGRAEAEAGLAKLSISREARFNRDANNERMENKAGRRPLRACVPTTVPNPGRVTFKNGQAPVLPATPEGVFVSPILPVAFVGFAAQGENPAGMLRCDFLKGGLDGEMTRFEGASNVVDVAISGDRVVTQSGGRLTVWRLDENQRPVKTVTFEPFGPGTTFGPNKDQALLVGADMLLTINTSTASVFMWRIQSNGSVKAVWFWMPATAGGTAKCTVSPCRDAIHIVDEGVALLTATGTLLDEQFGHSRGWPVQFVPDGKSVSVVDPSLYDSVISFALTGDRMGLRHLIPAGISFTGTREGVWVDNTHLLLAGKYLYDIELEHVVWVYPDLPGNTVLAGNGLAVTTYAGADGKQSLYVANIVGDRLKLAVKGYRAGDFLLFYKGQTVSLKGNMKHFPPRDAEAFTNLFNLVMDAAGMKVVNSGAQVEFNVVTSPPAERPSLNDGRFTSGIMIITSGGVQTPVPYKLEVKQDKQVVWSTESAFMGGSFIGGQGGSMVVGASVEMSLFPGYLPLPVEGVPVKKGPMFPEIGGQGARR